MRKCGLTECTLSINEIYSVFKYNKSRPNCPCTHTPPPTRTHLPNIRRNSCALRKLDTVFVFSYHPFAHMPLTNFVRPNACHWLKMCCYVCVSVSLYTSIEAGENERIMSDVCLFFSIFSRYSVPPRSVRDACVCVCGVCTLCALFAIKGIYPKCLSVLGKSDKTRRDGIIKALAIRLKRGQEDDDAYKKPRVASLNKFSALDGWRVCVDRTMIMPRDRHTFHIRKTLTCLLYLGCIQKRWRSSTVDANFPGINRHSHSLTLSLPLFHPRLTTFDSVNVRWQKELYPSITLNEWRW